MRSNVNHWKRRRLLLERKAVTNLLLGRKAITNLDSILKGRDITLPTKVYLVKAMVFPVVMCGCESWTIKNFERQRIDTFELGCWRRLLRVPWTARRSNQSILKKISSEYSLEGLILKLKLQYLIWWSSTWFKKLTHFGKLGMLQSMVSQRIRHDWVTELNWTDLCWQSNISTF